jgi:ABC-2 type transport system ATP-binding protein
LPKGTVSVDHVWKRFRADRGEELRLRSQVTRIGRHLRGHRRSYRWVLKDVTFQVDPGQTLALIGVNGSGKSTLLKVISHVTYETAGRAAFEGRVGALLEVRSGIHPELSGRENVFLYGTLLGLPRRVLAERFDAIVEFAELEDAIDRQVKFYSSGMGVRLGFAIAAFLEPDVLLVDEVLAVGDASFQQKCLQRISDVVAAGATLIFVSHDLAAVGAMCERAIWLADAVVQADGPTHQVLGLYRKAIEENASLTLSNKGSVRVLKVDVAPAHGNQVLSGQPAEIRVVYNAPDSGKATFFLGVSEGPAMPMFLVRQELAFPKGDFELRCTLDDVPLPRGRYYLWSSIMGARALAGQGVRPNLSWQPIGSFEAFGPFAPKPPPGVMMLSPVHVDATWEVS